MRELNQLEPGQVVIINGIKATRFDGVYIINTGLLQISQHTAIDAVACLDYWISMFNFGVKKHDQLRYYGGEINGNKNVRWSEPRHQTQEGKNES